MNIFKKLMKLLKKKDSLESSEDDALDEKINTIINDALDKLMEHLVDMLGSSYQMEIFKNKKSTSLNSGQFILTFSYDTLSFFLTFRLGLDGKEVALLCKYIFTVIEPNEVTIIDDSYYDVEEKLLKFGDDALESRQKNMLKTYGKQQCPVCEQIYKLSFFNDEGICKICDKIQENIIWN